MCLQCQQTRRNRTTKKIKRFYSTTDWTKKVLRKQLKEHFKHLQVFHIHTQHINTHPHKHTYICMHTYVSVLCINTRTHAYMYTSIHMYDKILNCMIILNMYMYVCIHTYACIHAHMYACVHIYNKILSCIILNPVISSRADKTQSSHSFFITEVPTSASLTC